MKVLHIKTKIDKIDGQKRGNHVIALAEDAQGRKICSVNILTVENFKDLWPLILESSEEIEFEPKPEEL